MNDSKRERLINSIQPEQGLKKGLGLGILFAPIVLGISLFLSEALNLWNYVVAFIFPFIPMVIIPLYLEKLNSKKREYLSFIDNHRVLSLDEIATSLSLSYDTVSKDINKMISQGFWGNAHIDSVTRSIVLPLNGVNINTQVVKSTKECPNCRAMNEISSLKENKCEYCGTLLD